MKRIILFLSLIAFDGLAGMEPDLKEIQKAESQNLADLEPLWADKTSYISHLPKELYALLMNYCVQDIQKSLIAFSNIDLKNAKKVSSIKPRVALFTGQHMIIGGVNNIEFRNKEDISKIEYSFKPNQNIVNCLAYDSKHNYLISGAYDSTIKIWDLRNLSFIKEPVRILSGSGHAGSIEKLIIDTACNRLYSSSDQSEIKIWDLESFDCINTIYGSQFLLDEKNNRLIIPYGFGLDTYDLQKANFSILKLKQKDEPSYYFESLAFDQDKNIICALGRYSNGSCHVKALNLTSNEYMPTLIKNDLLTSFMADNLNLLFLISENSSEIITTTIHAYDYKKNVNFKICDIPSDIYSNFFVNGNKIFLLSSNYDSILELALFDSSLTNSLNVYKIALFRLAYECLISQTNSFFLNRKKLDLTKDALLLKAFNALPKTIQSVMRKRIMVIEPIQVQEKGWLRWLFSI